MKKFTLIIFLAFAGSSLFSQDDLFLKIKKQLKEQHPELMTDNKLIAVSFWSSGNQVSRELNIQLEKTVSVYQGAKLKGGLKGIVGIVICLDADKTSSKIVLGKDKITNLLTLEGVDYIAKAGDNFIFDSMGQNLKTNISFDSIYEFVHQLITR